MLFRDKVEKYYIPLFSTAIESTPFPANVLEFFLI